METNFGVRSRSIRWLYLATRESHWRVMSVERPGGGGRRHVLRGRPREARVHARRRDRHVNCGACEPECPVEAIFPEDALPDKWNAFVEINYAFPDPAKINALTDAYATEHNVQNEPLEYDHAGSRYAQGRGSPGSGDGAIFVTRKRSSPSSTSVADGRRVARALHERVARRRPAEEEVRAAAVLVHARPDASDQRRAADGGSSTRIVEPRG